MCRNPSNRIKLSFISRETDVYFLVEFTNHSPGIAMKRQTCIDCGVGVGKNLTQGMARVWL